MKPLLIKRGQFEWKLTGLANVGCDLDLITVPQGFVATTAEPLPYLFASTDSEQNKTRSVRTMFGPQRAARDWKCSTVSRQTSRLESFSILLRMRGHRAIGEPFPYGCEVPTPN